MIKNVIKIIECLIKGHKSESCFTDGKFNYYTSRCSNCHTMLGMPKSKNYDCPPPAHEGVQMSKVEWNQWVDDNIMKMEMRLKNPPISSQNSVKKHDRVRFYPKGTEQTYEGTVLEETPYSYLVVPDDNLFGTARWNKKCCAIVL